MKKIQGTSIALALTLVLSLGVPLMMSQGKGGGDETGPYDVVPGGRRTIAAPAT